MSYMARSAGLSQVSVTGRQRCHADLTYLSQIGTQVNKGSPIYITKNKQKNPHKQKESCQFVANLDEFVLNLTLLLSRA